jgi:serine protease Do
MWLRWVAVTVVLVLVSAPAAAQPRQDLDALSQTLESLTRAVGPAVVQIFATGYVAGQGLVPPGGSLVSSRQATGSGIIVDPSGYIITNAHVIADAALVQVGLPRTLDATASQRSIVRPPGRLVGAQVVGVDRETDLAVLKVQVDRTLPSLELGDSDDLRPGQIVLAFGSPLGLENSVSLGVVSAVARQVRPDDPMIYIQTDASINPGNSGGPLVDVEGRVVGINTFILSQSGGSEGIGFASPSNIVSTIFEQIRQNGRVRRGEIGVAAQTITEELAAGLGLAQNWGVVLADVHPGGPAELAGLSIGDVVLNLDGKVMENARQLQVNLYQRGVGQTVAVDVLRGDRRLTYRVAPVERPGDPSRFYQMVRPDEHLIEQLGILGLTLTPEVGQLLAPHRTQQGVVVAASSANAAPARGQPLLPGDVIYAVNRQSVQSLGDLRGVLDALGPADATVLHIERGGQLMFLSF